MSVFGVFLVRIFHTFSCIRTEYAVSFSHIQSKCGKMWENADQSNSEYGHFLCSDSSHFRLGHTYFSHTDSKRFTAIIFLRVTMLCFFIFAVVNGSDWTSSLSSSSSTLKYKFVVRLSLLFVTVVTGCKNCSWFPKGHDEWYRSSEPCPLFALFLFTNFPAKLCA